MSVVEAVAHGCSDSRAVGAFLYDVAGCNPSGGQLRHARRAIAMGRLLNLVVGEEDELRLVDPAAVDLDTWTDELAIALFRRALQSMPVFMRYWHLVRRGIGPEQSATRLEAIMGCELGLSRANNAFVEWGVYSGLFIRDEDGVLMVDDPGEGGPTEGASEILADMTEAMQGELKARGWLEATLGTDAFDHLPSAVEQDLVEALTKCQSTPDDALKDAGNALEDYLKEVARIRGVPLVTAKGRKIDQIARLVQELRKHKAIADKHVGTLGGLEALLDERTLTGLGAFRNMPSHGRSVEDWERWQITDEIALTVVLQTVLAIRSLYYYAVTQKMVY